MSHKPAAACLGILAFCQTAQLALAAKPTDAFKKAVEAVWQKIEYSRMTGRTGKDRTFGVVLRDDLAAGSILGATDRGVMYPEHCVAQEVLEGSVRPPVPDKNDKNRLVRPVKRGTVVKLVDMSFKDTAVVLELWDDGQLVDRREIKTMQSKVQLEKFCTTLRVTVKPGGAALDGADAPGVLAAIEGVVKPFSSEQAAKDFAASLVAKQP